MFGEVGLLSGWLVTGEWLLASGPVGEPGAGATEAVGTIPLAGRPVELGWLRGLTPPAPLAGTNPESGFELNPDE